MVFSRTKMRVHPKVTAEHVPQTLEPFVLEAEMRPYSYFRNPGLYIAGMLSANDAYLISLPAHELHQLDYANVFSPMDIVVIDGQGVILQIFPKFVLSNITQPVQLPPESVAVLFLAPEAAKVLGLVPQYWIEHQMFYRPPEIVE